MLRDRLRRARVTEDEVLESARETHGIGSMKEIEHAVLEPTGKISIIPYH